MSPHPNVLLTEERTPPKARVQVRREHLDAAAALLGHRTDVALARFLGVTPRTLRRVRGGVVGDEFMAKAVAAFKPHADVLDSYGISVSLDGLFEVVTEAVAS